MSLRILITNNALAGRAGTELYVRDIAIALLRRGLIPIVFSPRLGEVAAEIRAATVPVIDRLDALAVRPDLIHGHHHLETMMALLHFPNVPAAYFCHGWTPWEEAPPKFPRIVRYVAVDGTCRDRLIYENGIPADRVKLLLNFVDVERFKPRAALPSRPRRALVFSNTASEQSHLKPVIEACTRSGVQIDAIGTSVGNAMSRPEEVIPKYDLVFAKGRSALEALAVGAAVILCDAAGAGPIVTTGEMKRLRKLNFGIRTLQNPLTPEALEREIARYDAKDAAAVSHWIQETAAMDNAVDELVGLYNEVLREYARQAPPEPAAEMLAVAHYLRWLKDNFIGASAAALADMANSPTMKLRNYISNLPIVGKFARSTARMLAKNIR